MLVGIYCSVISANALAQDQGKESVENIQPSEEYISTDSETVTQLNSKYLTINTESDGSDTSGVLVNHGYKISEDEIDVPSLNYYTGESTIEVGTLSGSLYSSVLADPVSKVTFRYNREFIKSEEYKKIDWDCRQDDPDFVTFFAKGCDTAIKSAYDSYSKRLSNEADVSWFNKLANAFGGNGEDWRKGLKEAAKDTGVSLAKSLGEKIINSIISSMFSKEKIEARYYGVGVEAFRTTYMLGNGNNPYSDQSACLISLKEINHQQGEINKYKSLYYANLDMVNYSLESSEITKYQDKADGFKLKLDDAEIKLASLNAKAEGPCAISDDYKQNFWTIIAYTDGSLLVYKTDLRLTLKDKNNNVVKNPFFDSPLVKDPLNCPVDSVSYENPACRYPKGDIMYYTHTAMLADTGEAGLDHLKPTSIVVMPGVKDGMLSSNKVHIFIGYGLDTVVTEKTEMKFNLRDIVGSFTGGWKYTKETISKGGYVAQITQTGNDGIDAIQPNVVSVIKVKKVGAEKASDFGVTSLHAKYKVKTNGEVIQYLLARQDKTIRDSDNFKTDMILKFIGDVVIPIPTDLSTDKIMNLGNTEEDVTNRHFRILAKDSNTQDDYQVTEAKNDEIPTVVYDSTQQELLLGYQNGNVKIIDYDDESFGVGQVRINDLLSSSDLSDSVQHYNSLIASDERYKDLKDGAKSCKFNLGCGQPITFIYEIPDDNIYLIGTDKSMAYVKRFQIAEDSNAQGYDVGIYMYDNHAEVFEGGVPVNAFYYQNRVYLVLNNGRIVSIAYNWYGKKYNSLVFDTEIATNVKLSSNADLKNALIVSQQFLFTKDGKSVAFTSTTERSNTYINLLSTKSPGLKGELINTNVPISGENGTSWKVVNNIRDLYWGLSPRKSSSPLYTLTNLRFDYDIDTDQPVGLLYAFGHPKFMYGAIPDKTVFTGALFYAPLTAKDNGGLYYNNIPPIMLRDNYICSSNIGNTGNYDDYIVERECHNRSVGPKYLKSYNPQWWK